MNREILNQDGLDESLRSYIESNIEDLADEATAAEEISIDAATLSDEEFIESVEEDMINEYSEDDVIYDESENI